ncbi:MAG TPA: hypothetical protein VMW73_01560 [Spirochaetia bacterium]|nr:hypothetical protein [Spirochaetia bacterium]
MLLTVPGNLLLAGEYAITEEGGLGLAFAVEPRVRVLIEQSRKLGITGVIGSERIEWPDDGERAQIFERILRCLPETDARSQRVHITIDSSRFYDEEGRKRGLGSSAALVVGLVYALADGRKRKPLELLRTCVKIHRAIQGGRGSGYDVAASLFGGTGLFTGGALPNWNKVTVPWLTGRRIFVVAGGRAVKSSPAVAAYANWKSAHRRQVAEFLADSNATVRALCDAQGIEAARRALERARELGIVLGDAIGIPAVSSWNAGPDWLCKASGAGNEVGICIGPESAVNSPAAPASAEPVVISADGVRIEAD